MQQFTGMYNGLIVHGRVVCAVGVSGVAVVSVVSVVSAIFVVPSRTTCRHTCTRLCFCGLIDFFTLFFLPLNSQ